jgi:hypothetical protein
MPATVNIFEQHATGAFGAGPFINGDTQIPFSLVITKKGAC